MEGVAAEGVAVAAVAAEAVVEVIDESDCVRWACFFDT